jgi:hypothetical protein
LAQCITRTGLTFVDELTSLDCAGRGIADPTGIEELTALTFLNLFGNRRLISIDVSANTALTGLELQSIQLTSVDVSANTALTDLFLGDNLLTSIDLSANTDLLLLDLTGNPDIPCSDIEAIDAQFLQLTFSHDDPCSPEGGGQ